MGGDRGARRWEEWRLRFRHTYKYRAVATFVVLSMVAFPFFVAVEVRDGFSTMNGPVLWLAAAGYLVGFVAWVLLGIAFLLFAPWLAVFAILRLINRLLSSAWQRISSTQWAKLRAERLQRTRLEHHPDLTADHRRALIVAGWTLQVLPWILLYAAVAGHWWGDQEGWFMWPIGIGYVVSMFYLMSVGGVVKAIPEKLDLRFRSSRQTRDFHNESVAKRASDLGISHGTRMASECMYDLSPEEAASLARDASKGGTELSRRLPTPNLHADVEYTELALANDIGLLRYVSGTDDDNEGYEHLLSRACRAYEDSFRHAVTGTFQMRADGYG